MMPLRLLAGIAASAAVAAFVAGAYSPRPQELAPAPVAPASAAVAAAPPAGEPLPPIALPGPRPQVPAGILARAADARALDRGPSCQPPEVERTAPRCAPEQRESIEIEWHVAPER